MNNIKLSAFADEASVSFDEQIIAMKENGIDFWKSVALTE